MYIYIYSHIYIYILIHIHVFEIVRAYPLIEIVQSVPCRAYGLSCSSIVLDCHNQVAEHCPKQECICFYNGS